jgi:DNA polymerase-3 subunit delta'
MKVHEVKNSIIESFHENNNPHAFLIYTNNLDQCYRDILDIVRIVNCNEDGRDECECSACKLFKSNNSPDFIDIKPDGKDIKVNQVEKITSQFITKPLINKYQIYLINEADKLNIVAANKLLKFLEEPSEGIVGILITDNIRGILPTIKSRCTVFNFNYEFTNLLSLLNITEEVFEKYYLDAVQIVYNLENLEKYQLLKYLKDISKKERNDILEIFKLVLKIYTIKFENRLHSCYNELEFTEQIINLIQDDDEYSLVKKINNINMIINLISNNTNRDLTLTRLAVIWE